MDKFKKLTKLSMRMLTEAENYADDYMHCTDKTMKDLYYSLANGHTDMYNKVHNVTATYVMRLETEKPEEHAKIIYDFLAEYENELISKIRDKLNQ